MKISITLPQTVLMGLAALSGQKDVRHYLNGVCIEFASDATYLVATDGTVLGVYRHPEVIQGNSEGRILIPWKVLTELKSKSKYSSVTLIFEGSDNCYTLRLERLGEPTLEFTKLETHYVAWRRVLKVDNPTGEPSFFASGVIEKVEKAVKLIAGDFPFGVQHNGKGACQFTTENPNFMGLIAPLNKVSPLKYPDWFNNIE